MDDRKLLEASYNVESKALEPRLEINLPGIQSTLDEIAPVDPRAKTVKPQEMVDSRFLDEMNKSGFMDQLWGGKEVSKRYGRRQQAGLLHVASRSETAKIVSPPRLRVDRVRIISL